MIIQIDKHISVKENQFTFTEIYNTDYAYFLTNNAADVIYCRRTNACYRLDESNLAWTKVDQSVELAQLKTIQEQIGNISIRKETHNNQHKFNLSGRGMTAALRGSLIVQEVKGLEHTCYIDYYRLSKLLSFASPELANNEIIVDSDMKVNIQGTKIESKIKVASINTSAAFPNISTFA